MTVGDLKMDMVDCLPHSGFMMKVGSEVSPLCVPPMRLKASARQDPESPLAENTLECLSIGMTGPLPRLLVLAGKIFAGTTRNVIRPTKGCTSPRAVLKDNQVLVAVGVENGLLGEVVLGDLVLERHDTVGGEFEGSGVGG